MCGGRRTETEGSETYHRLELEVVVEVRHSDHHEGAIVVLEADRQHGCEEALCKVMKHLPPATKLCRQSGAEQRSQVITTGLSAVKTQRSADALLKSTASED